MRVVVPYSLLVGSLIYVSLSLKHLTYDFD